METHRKNLIMTAAQCLRPVHGRMGIPEHIHRPMGSIRRRKNNANTAIHQHHWLRRIAPQNVL